MKKPARRIRIEYVYLDRLKPDPENPKDHDGEKIAEAFRQRGFVDPVLVDESTGYLVAGHGRVEQLQKMRDAGEPAPDGIEVLAKGWLVPVVKGIAFADRDQARAHLLAQKIGETGGWIENRTGSLLRKLGESRLKGTGFTNRDLSKLLGKLRTSKPGDDVVPEAPAEPTTKAGELWQLGAHRLLCGDTFKEEDRARLVGKLTVSLILMDPPYAIYGSSSGIGADIADDKMVRPFFEQLGRTAMKTVKTFGHVYVCCDWRSYAALWDGFKRATMSPKNCLVWDKGGGGLGSNYANTYELIAFFSRLPPPKAMSSSQKAGQRTVHASNVLRYQRPRGDERQHNAAKPVAMFQKLIENSTDEGEVVVDFFGGSGPTVIAAEKCGRVALIMETEPRTCDVIVKRWEKMTGKRAKLLAS